jgi:hypothetical protein
MADIDDRGQTCGIEGILSIRLPANLLDRTRPQGDLMYDVAMLRR